MRDLYSTNVEAAAYLAREDPWAPYLDDDRPTRAELEAEEEADRRFEQRRGGAGAMSVAQMQRGAVRARRRKEREAVSRVRAYKAWLRAGGDFRSMPPVPRDWEFRAARRAGL